VAAQLAASQEGLSSMSEFIWLWNLVISFRGKANIENIGKNLARKLFEPKK
jgi:hypothetical protein